MKKLYYFFAMTFFLSACSFDNKVVDLKSSVGFNYYWFEIKNNDSLDYVDCKLEVNDKFRVEHINIPAGETVKIPFGEFADSDGMRLTNDFKPLSFSLWCDYGEDKNGQAYMTW